MFNDDFDKFDRNMNRGFGWALVIGVLTSLAYLAVLVGLAVLLFKVAL